MNEVRVSPRCPICDSQGLPQPLHPDADIYRCVECKHCYTDTASISVPETYSAEYFEDTHRNWFSNPNVTLFELVRRDAALYGSHLSVLDVGCGRGDLLHHLHREEPDWQLTGLDLSPNVSEPGIRFIQGDIFELPATVTYDVVTSLLVIEHIADVKGFVDALRKLGRPGGRLIITTNNEQGILYAVARALRRLGRAAAYDRLYSRHHVNHFSVATLKRLLKHQGFEEVRTIHHNIPIAAVDLPPAGPITRTLWRVGVRAAFVLGALSRRTFLQTVVATVPECQE
jgi:SAM-dependent methyltransferase